MPVGTTREEPLELVAPRRRRRLHSLVISTGLVAAMALALTPNVEAARPCSVKNLVTGVRYGPDLQGAIDAATNGDVIKVGGTCVGGIAISVDLTLVGSARHGIAATTLDAQGIGPEVIIDGAVVTLRDLRITGATSVAGIENVGGDLTLDGATTVTGNASSSGAGVSNEGGTLTLRDTASISGNAASGNGGGILNWNFAADGTGLGSIVRLFGSSTVSGNDASGDGGGIYNHGGLVEMYDLSTGSLDSTVSGNTAGGTGGGIFNDQGYLLDTIAYPDAYYNVFGNDPDDIVF